MGGFLYRGITDPPVGVSQFLSHNGPTKAVFSLGSHSGCPQGTADFRHSPVFGHYAADRSW